ncbi:MAG: carboxyl transferase domain-containing protein [Negativicoccus succinicivorans]|uniref:methylmalonyl-CoA decarboxylase subunit alpha n=1 Tax=Negativicoccus succinicivorans TaxID=620903 RepID=UPI002906CFF8|nr:carboxyl transferase domain-containing protein [Negativicoccus succinicivorans]MDU5395957.1 carboxyl transferase domain-containing protein [Negativicoccus succinicivorans]
MSVNQQKVELLHKNLEHVRMGGGQSRIDKQHAKGKMTARERLQILFDEGSFVEIGALVKHRCVNFGQDKKDLPGEGVVTGYGTVDGKLVYAFAQDFTVEGGSLGEMHASKIVRVLQLSLKMGAPCVGLNDSGGARIQEAVDALSGYGRIFFENTIASGVVPQISAIMGPSAGGAVYSPALTDFIYMVEGTSQMFITGPAVVKSVTGEDVTAEKLGGAMTHNSISGVSHFIAKDDEDCLNQIRYLLGFLPSNNMEEAPIVDTGDDPMRMDESLNTLLPDNSNAAYDMYDVIKSIVDNGEYYDVLAHYAKNIITCFARFDGQTVGIIANQPKFMAGCLDINASDKSSRFIRFCDAFNIPLVNLVDVPGFLPGVQQEYGGIIRHGAKMLFAYSEATVPKVTVITRKAYGGSYLAMCSQDLGADQVFAWPTSEIAVMGPAGAANIIFRKDPDKEQKTAEYVEEFATPYKAAERGFVDAVIEPKQTRPYIINALAMLASKREARPAKKHANIPL